MNRRGLWARWYATSTMWTSSPPVPTSSSKPPRCDLSPSPTRRKSTSSRTRRWLMSRTTTFLWMCSGVTKGSVASLLYISSFILTHYARQDDETWKDILTQNVERLREQLRSTSFDFCLWETSFLDGERIVVLRKGDREVVLNALVKPLLDEPYFKNFVKALVESHFRYRFAANETIVGGSPLLHSCPPLLTMCIRFYRTPSQPKSGQGLR